MEVRGHSWETNLPARRIIYTRDLYEPVQELAARIANAARNVLESTPPELAADVSGTGILLTGGGLAAARAGRVYRGRAAHRCGHRPRPVELRGPRHGNQPERGQVSERRVPDATPKVWNRRLNHSHDPFTGE